MRLKKIAEEIGPLLAGFQIAASVVGFFGIGAVAKWIINHWLPFTRWIWGYVWEVAKNYIPIIHWPDLSIADKDALTTLAFFTPMAISALLNRKKSKSDLLNAREIRHKIYATFLGIIFMMIVGSRVIQDAITLFTTQSPESISGSNGSLLNTTLFANIGLISTGMFVVLILTYIIYRTFYKKRLPMKISENGEELEDIKNKIELKNIYLKNITSISITANVLASSLSFFTVSGGILIAAKQLGPIRTISPILVLLSLLITIFYNPSRLMRTAGVVIALVLASYGWDFAIWIVKAVESAPKL